MKPKNIVCVDLRSIIYEDRYHNYQDSNATFSLINGAKEFVLELSEDYSIEFYCDKALWKEHSIPYFLRNIFGKEFKFFIKDTISGADFYIGHNHLELPINSEKSDFDEILSKIKIKMENYS